MNKMIEINNVLNGLSLSVDEGSFCTVLGSGGSGKTTLARVLIGLEETKGTIKISASIDEMVCLFENPNNQLYTDTVREEILYAANAAGLSIDKFEKKIVKLNELIPISKLLDKEINSLSSSEKQLIVLISALFQFPNVLILDESISMMDSKLKEKVYKLLSMYNKNGMTIVNMTSNVEDCMHGDTVIILNNKTVVYQGKLNEALKKDFFTDNGIKAPFITELTSKLKYYKVVKKVHYNIHSLAGELWG